MAEDNTANMVERALATFQSKGPQIKMMSPSKRDREGNIVEEGTCDTMEREFRPYVYRGNRSQYYFQGEDLAGSEEEFFQAGKEARDNRLVGMADGRVVHAAGSLGDGTAMLYDANGRPVLRNGQQPPVQQTKRRSTKEW